MRHTDLEAEPELANAIRELEECLLEPGVRADPKQIAPLLADEFLEFGSSGRIWSRSAALAELPKQEPFSASLSDFRVRQLSPGRVLATYRLTTISRNLSKRSLRSSVWVQNGERWQMLFHQGTPFEAASNQYPRNASDSLPRATDFKRWPPWPRL